jgi:hypothetical protein
LNPSDATPLVEWVKAISPILAGVGLGVAGFFLNKRLETHKANINAEMKGYEATVTATMQNWLEENRKDAARGLERLKAELSEDVQRRLDLSRANAAKDLEGMKADLGHLSRLRTTAEEKHAEIAADVLFTGLEYIGVLVHLTTMTPLAPVQRDLALEAQREEEMNVRWIEAARPYDEKFHKAWRLVESYLPEEVHELFERVWNLKCEIRAEQVSHAGGGGREAFRAGFGAAPEGRLVELRAEMKSLLRPLALPAAVGAFSATSIQGGAPSTLASSEAPAPAAPPTNRPDAPSTTP